MKIVLLNLERATERRTKMITRFEKLGLEFDIHKALDWHDLTEQHRSLVDHAAIRRRKGRPGHMDYGRLACWLSHRQVLLDLIDTGPEMVAVFEDDVEFAPQLPEVLNRIACLQEPFDIIFLHRGGKRKIFPHVSLGRGYQLGWLYYSNFGAQGYVITRTAAQHFLACSLPIRFSIDHALSRYWQHGLITYGLDPPVVYHRNEGISFIREKKIQTLSWRINPVGYVQRRWLRITDDLHKKITFYSLIVNTYNKRLWTMIMARRRSTVDSQQERSPKDDA